MMTLDSSPAATLDRTRAAVRTSRPPRVLYVQYTNPAAYPPIEHGARLLADAGCRVRFVGTDILGDSLRLKPHPRIDVRLWSHRGRGARQKAHYASFLAWAVTTAASWRADWIYASDPMAAPIALAARAVTGARIVYHEHDSPADAGAHAESWFMTRVRSARTRLARAAQVCILPNLDRSRRFSRETGRQDVATIWNVPMRDEISPAPRPVSSDLRVLYHGSIVPTRLPVTVVQALAQLPRHVSLTIAGYETAGHPGHVAALLAAATRDGVGDRVRYVGTVPAREDLMRQCASCDVGLALMPLTTDDPNEDAMVGASNKVFDYMAGGLAVLVSDRPDWRSTFVDGGFGAACDPASPASIAAALGTWLAHPDERTAAGERGRLKIATDWNYDAMFAPVVERLSTSNA